MAHGGEGAVVVLGRHRHHLGTDGGPDLGGPLHVRAQRGLDRREHHLARRRTGRHRHARRPATSLPAIGWAGTKAPIWSCRPRRAASITSPLVEPTSITSILIVDAVADRLERLLGSADRDRDQHQVGARHRQQRRWRCDVDHTQLAGAFGGGGRLAVADHALHQLARLSASANEPPIKPQPIRPSCSNIVGARPPPEGHWRALRGQRTRAMSVGVQAVTG